MMGQKLMMIAATMSTGIDMHGHGGQVRLCIKEYMAYLFSNVVTLSGRKILIDRDMQFRVQFVPNPTETHIMDILCSRNATRCPLHRFDHLRVNGIHEPTPHGHGGIFDDKQDGNGNKYANDRVSQRKPEETSHRSNEYREGGQPIYPCVLPISHQRC